MTIYRGIVTGLALVLAGQPLSAQSDSTPPAPSRVPTDRVTVPNLTEAIGGRFAGATMLRPDGLSSTGGLLRMRGWRSLLFSNDPALEIDGVILPVQPAAGLGGTQLLFVPLLDLLDPDEIDRIEVEPGLTTGVGRGAGLVNGVIRVTTRRGSPGTRFSAGSEWGASSTPFDFGLPNYFTTAAGGGPGGCPLMSQALRACEPGQLLLRNGATDPLIRQAGTGTHGRFRLGARGTTGRLRYAASGRWSSGRGAIDLPPSERARLETVIGDQAARLARPDRLGELFGRGSIDLDLGKGVSVAVAGNVARQTVLTPATPRMPSGGGTFLMNYLADPRYPDSAAWITGDLLRPADFYRRASDRELLRRVVSAGVTWEPTRHFRSWLRVAGVWDRHHQRIAAPDTFTFGGQNLIRVDSLAYQDDQVQLELGLSQAVDLGPVRLTVAPAYQMRDRQPTRYIREGYGDSGTEAWMEDAYRVAGGALRTDLTTRDGRVGVSGVVRRDEARRFERWEAPIWGYNLRGWWTGMVSGHVALGVAARRPDVDGPMISPAITVGPELVREMKPERTRELEAGLRTRDPGGWWDVGVVGFSQRTTDGWGSRLDFSSMVLRTVTTNVGAEIANTGIEVDATAWLARGPTWQLRTGFVGALLSSTLKSSGEGTPPSVAPGVCSYYEGHHPFSRCGWPMGDVRDLDGDGLLSAAEYQVTAPTSFGPRGSSIPTRTAGVWFDVTRTLRFGAVSLLGHFDYLGGHWSEGYMAMAQCFYAACREANDPSSSIQEQAAAFAQPETYFLRDASFGRMRELALAWQTSGGLARWLSAERVSLSLTARNLFTISGFRYWDPEVRQRAHEYAPLDREVIPLPRTFTVKFAVDW